VVFAVSAYLSPFDAKSLWEGAAQFGVVGVVGTGIGAAMGAGFASYWDSRGLGDPSFLGFLYWPVWAAIGIVVLIFALETF
jgi:hypothetical protein